MGDGSKVAGTDAQVLVVASEADAFTLRNLADFFLEDTALASLGFELGGVEGNGFPVAVDLYSKKVPFRHCGKYGGLAVVLDARAPGFEVNLVTCLVGLSSHAAAGLLFDKDGHGVSIAPELAFAVEV